MSGKSAVPALRRIAEAVTAALVAGADRLLDGAAGADPAERRLFRSFTILHMIGPPCGLPICAVLFAISTRGGASVAIATLGVGLFWTIPLMLRWTRSIELPALASVQLLVLGTLFGSYHFGGFHSPFTVWLLVAVLLSFLYATRVIAWCLGGAAMQAAIFLGVLAFVPPEPEILGKAAWTWLFIVSTLAATLYISLTAAFYARLKTEGSAVAESLLRHQEAARALSAEIAQAQAADAESAAFLASASHQLRTPLNVVIGYSELLIEDAQIDEREVSQRQLLQIVASSRALLNIVDEVVDLAEAGTAFDDEAVVPVDAPTGSDPQRRRRTSNLFRHRGNQLAALILSRRPIVLGLSALVLAALLLSMSVAAQAPLLAACAAAGLGAIAGMLLPRLLGKGRGLRRRGDEPTRDELTGLRNRASFQSQLDRMILRGRGETVAVLFADLDGFKEVNDSLGHDAGDQLLREVGQRFLALTPRDILLARLGGDEFGAAAFGPDAAERIQALAEAMADAVTDPIATDEDHLTIGVSVGISAGRTGAITSRELLRRSDVAMYRAKSDKRQPIQAFELHMDEALSFRRTMRKDLAVAISEDQLHLLLQPVVGARTGALAGAEALLRWNHPVLGAVSPAKLIPLAEESGQIIAIDDWVLEQALRFARTLEDVPIAVNISPVQFRHPGFARKIVDRLAAHDIPAHLLKLEITEGVLVTHTRAASRAVNELREAGIKIALDDFGTGFSSLSYLKDFQFDSLKIDRSFVVDLEKGRQSAELLRAIVDLGHSLNMTVIAEGVETAGQASLIQLLGCDYIQGYFTGRPMALDALEEMKRSLLASASAAPAGVAR